MSELESLLCEGAELMDISFSDEQLDQLLAYHGLIGKWNKVYNLSAIRDPIESIKKHFLDSLSYYLRGLGRARCPKNRK